MFQGITDNPQHTQWIFYDTHFSRNDILNLIKLESQPQQFRKYIIDNILVNWKQKDASENRNEVFVDQLSQLYRQFFQLNQITQKDKRLFNPNPYNLSYWHVYMMHFQEREWRNQNIYQIIIRFMNSQHFTAEQKSAVMSLAYEIFIKSMEKKMTQIDSFNLLKQALQEQTKIYSTQTIPIFTQESCKKIIEFIKASFYRYYSLYEITMTKFIDLNIYSNYKFDNDFPPLQPLSSYKRIDNPAEVPLLRNLFNKIHENEEEEDYDDHEGDTQEKNHLETENIEKESPKKRVLTGEELAIQLYVEDKFNTYSKDATGKVVQSQEQALEQANNIINPPKKK